MLTFLAASLLKHSVQLVLGELLWTLVLFTGEALEILGALLAEPIARNVSVHGQGVSCWYQAPTRFAQLRLWWLMSIAIPGGHVFDVILCISGSLLRA